MDLDTQEIISEVRDASTLGEDENVFFLYVATPRKPPGGLHKKIIEPFLKTRGWQKVSFKSTGFRALYFLRKKDDDANCTNGASNSCESSHNVNIENEVVSISSDEDASAHDDGGPSASKRRKLESADDSLCFSSTQKATNHRTELKRLIEDYKTQKGLSFHVHIVLSRPIDYEEDFEELSNSMEY